MVYTSLMLLTLWRDKWGGAQLYQRVKALIIGSDDDGTM
jgi:hypothetical protein